MSTDVHHRGTVDVAVSRASKEDALEIVRIVATGRVAVGRAGGIDAAARAGATGQGYMVVVRFNDHPKPVAVVGCTVEGKLLPRLATTVITSKNSTDLAVEMILGAVGRALLDALEQRHGRGALTCEVKMTDGAIGDVLVKNGWTATGTVRDGYRRYVRLLHRESENEGPSSTTSP